MRWEISGNRGVHARSGVDARGWLWEIMRGDQVAQVVMEISWATWLSDPNRGTGTDLGIQQTLFELILSTGMRKGEALGLHWADVDLEAQILFVRCTLSNINNATPVLTAPKTRSSHAWIGLSQRAVRALRRQAERQRTQRLTACQLYRDNDLVFTRHNGQPLRPEYVLRHFYELTDQAGLPRIRVHDLRHFAATTMLSSQVPLAMASKAMRHSTLSTTTEVYGHLLRHVAHQAVNAIDAALTKAENNPPAA